MAEVSPDYIDAILSTQFDECSIAAADAARLAANHDRSFAKYQSLQPIREAYLERTQPYLAEEIYGLNIDHPAVAKGEVSLCLLRDASVIDDRPVLAAKFNHDVVLQIAGFNKRSHGQCSFVQLGQEIEEDNIVATPGAPRSDYIEAVRRLIGLKPGNKLDDKDEELIRTLVKCELDRHEHELLQALYPAANRSARRYFKPEEKLSLTMLGESSGVGEIQFEARLVTAIGDGDSLNAIDDAREVKLYLASASEPNENGPAPKRTLFKRKKEEAKPKEPGELQLIAVTRGNIGLSLLTFTENGHVISSSDLDEPRALRAAIAVLDETAEQNRREILKLRNKYLSAKTLNKSVYITRFSQSDIDVHIDKPGSGGGYSHTKHEIKVDGDWTEFKNELITKHYLLKPEMQKAVFSRDDLWSDQFSKLLNISQELTEYLGPSDSPTEVLLHNLGRLLLVGSNFRGILPNKRAGKTITDVDTQVSITGRDTQVRVQVLGRPVSLDGFDPVTLFDETLRFDKPNSIDEDKASELHSVIGAICTKETVV